MAGSTYINFLLGSDIYLGADAPHLQIPWEGGSQAKSGVGGGSCKTVATGYLTVRCSSPPIGPLEGSTTAFLQFAIAFKILLRHCISRTLIFRTVST